MRIVLDTNVLMSGIFWKGTSRKLLDAWQERLLTLVASPDIVAEYERVGGLLSQRYPRSADLAAQVIQRVLATTEIVDAPPLPKGICTDADDDKFIACALSAHAVQCIVTGDKALRVGGAIAGVPTLTPRECLSLLQR